MAYRKARAVELFVSAFFAKYTAILHPFYSKTAVTVQWNKGNRWKKPETHTETKGQLGIFVEKAMNTALAVFKLCYEQKKECIAGSISNW